jgi:hypothetical protein
MMTPHVQDVIAKAERRGVTLFVRDGRLGASPMSAVTEELGAHIRAHKAELIAALASTPVAMDLPSEDRRQEPPSHCGRARRWKITTATGQVLLHSSPGGLTRQEAIELSKDWGEVAACVPVEEGALSSEESSYVGESRSDGSVCKDSGDRFMGISGAAEDILPGDGAPRMGQVNQEIQPGYSGALGDGGDRPDLKKKGRQDVPAELPNHGGRTLLTRTETRERHKEILARVKEGEPVYVYSHTLAEGVLLGTRRANRRVPEAKARLPGRGLLHPHGAPGALRPEPRSVESCSPVQEDLRGYCAEDHERGPGMSALALSFPTEKG